MYCLALEVREIALLFAVVQLNVDGFPSFCKVSMVMPEDSFSNSLSSLGKIFVIMCSHPLSSTLKWIFYTVVFYIPLSTTSCLKWIPPAKSRHILPSVYLCYLYIFLPMQGDILSDTGSTGVWVSITVFPYTLSCRFPHSVCIYSSSTLNVLHTPIDKMFSVKTVFFSSIFTFKSLSMQFVILLILSTLTMCKRHAVYSMLQNDSLKYQQQMCKYNALVPTYTVYCAVVPSSFTNVCERGKSVAKHNHIWQQCVVRGVYASLHTQLTMAL